MKVLAVAAVAWIATLAAFIAVIEWHARRRRTLPEEAVLVLIVGEPTAWVLTDLGVATVPAPTDLAGIDRLLTQALEGRL